MDAYFRRTTHRLPMGLVLIETVTITPMVPDTAAELLAAIDGTGPVTRGPKPSGPDRKESK